MSKLPPLPEQKMLGQDPHRVGIYGYTTEQLQAYIAQVGEMIEDEYWHRLQGDLENGAKWLNERAAEDFKRRMPLMNDFGGWLQTLLQSTKEDSHE